MLVVSLQGCLGFFLILVVRKPATHAPETVNRNLHEKYDASSSQFLAPEKWQIEMIFSQ